MMVYTSTNWQVATGGAEERLTLLQLMYFEPYVHQLPGWRALLAWLGNEDAFFFLHDTDKRHLLGAWASPPEGPWAWLRLFAVAAPLEPRTLWEAVWPTVAKRLRQRGVRALYTIPYKDWFRHLVETVGFQPVTEVIFLAWTPQWLPPAQESPGLRLRPATLDDIPAMLEVDRAAFSEPWQMSADDMKAAMQGAVLTTVAESPHGVVGFQISTPSPAGGHLARLAVHPSTQGRGLGRRLVREVLAHFAAQGAARVTVNTWRENAAALALYQKLGFRPTGKAFPLYRLLLENSL